MAWRPRRVTSLCFCVEGPFPSLIHELAISALFTEQPSLRGL